MPTPRSWKSVLSDPRLIGGDLEFELGSGVYRGKICGFKEINEKRIMFFFSTSARNTLTAGWRKRAIASATVEKQQLAQYRRNGPIHFGLPWDHRAIYLKGCGELAPSDFQPKFTRKARRYARLAGEA